MGRDYADAQRSLRDSDTALRAFIDALPGPGFLLDQNGIILEINEAMAKSIGGEKDRLLGRNAFDLLPPESAKSRNGYFKQVVQTGLPAVFEDQRAGKCFLNYMYPVPDDNQTVSGVAVIALDITERKRVEQELKNSEERLKLLFDFAPDAYYLSNLKGVFLDGNREAEKLLGYKKEELIGKSFLHSKILPGGQLPKAAMLLANNALGKSTGPDEFTLIRKDGTQVIVEIRTYPVKLKGQTVVLGIARDTSERKRAEEAQRKEISFRNTVIKRAAEGLCVCHEIPEFPFVAFSVWNDRMAQITGYTMEEINRLGWYQMMYPDPHVRERAIERMSRMRCGEDLIAEEWTITRADGQRRILSISTSLLDAGNGRPQVLAMMQDITEHEKAEQTLRQREEYFRSLIENGSDIITVMDSRATIRYASPSIERILGYKPEELIGTNSYALMHPDDLKRLSPGENLLSALGTPGFVAPAVELRDRHKDGSWRHLEVIARSILNLDGEMAIVANARDISERKQAVLLQNAVYQIAQAADKSASLDELFKSVHEIVGTVMPASNFYIALDDREKDLISFPYFVDEADPPPAPKKPGKGLTEYVIRTGRSLLCDEKQDMDLRRRGEVELVGSPSAIWLGVPLAVDGKTIGAMVVQHYSDPNAYNQRELRMLEYVSSQVARSIQRKRAEEAIRRQMIFDRLMTGLLARFASCAPAQIDENIRAGLRDLAEFLGADHAYVLLFSGNPTRYGVSHEWCAPHVTPGYPSFQNVPKGRLPWCEKKIISGEVVRINTLSDFPPDAAADYRFHNKEGAKSVINVPISGVTIEVIGCIGLHSHIHEVMWSEEDVTHIKMVGDSIAHALERKHAEDNLYQSIKQLRTTLRAAINALSSAIEMRDPYTAGHQERVTKLAIAIAEAMGLEEEQLEAIQIAGIVHDIGKLSIPAEILSKPTNLNDIEYSLLKTHSFIGYSILSKIDFPWPIAQIVHQHHERIDGSGYPQGIPGKDILIEAKILGVADVVEAMSSHRPYRPALGIDQALEEISSKKGIFYDPEVVDTCLRLFSEKKFRFENSV